MLLESLKERWKAIEEIGSDAEKRGEVLGVVPSWQPAIEGETFDFLPRLPLSLLEPKFASFVT